MYARMTTIQTQPGTIDKAIRIAQDAVLPAARQQPGFKGVLALAGRNGAASCSTC